MKRSDEKKKKEIKMNSKKKKNYYLIACTPSCVKKPKSKENFTKQITKQQPQ